MNPYKQLQRTCWLAFISIGLTACGGDSDNSSNAADTVDDVVDEVAENTYQTLSVNAASYENWKYVNLTQGTVLDLDEESAATSLNWHIALRRTEIKLNGGVSGSGSVTAAVADMQEEFYDAEGIADVSVFTNADADIEVQALAVAYDVSALTYQTDTYEPALTDWYVYNTTTHQIGANTDVGYLLRHADGVTYSKLIIDAVSYTDISVRYEIQAEDTVQFAGGEHTFSAEFTDDATELCLDLDTESAIDCANSADWDLRYEVNLSARAINIWTNGGVYGSGNGAVFGSIDAIELAEYTSATNLDSYDISGHYLQDSSHSIFADSSWYAYNLNGSHKLWPNFRTYLINLDGADETSIQIALQVANYYSLGDSGSPELRFQNLVTE